jgi:acyl-[acyl-carrier-protein]-phospholipid O-acyltransferase/long-chain-fatty-acid--[acyl-carrier-protein] ligase
VKRSLSLFLAVLQLSPAASFAATLRQNPANTGIALPLAAPSAVQPGLPGIPAAVPSLKTPSAVLPLPAALPASALAASKPSAAALPAAASGKPKAVSASLPQAQALAAQSAAASAGPAAPQGGGTFDGGAEGAKKSVALPDLPPEPAPLLTRRFTLARLAVAPLFKLLYRVRPSGLEHLPQGPAVIVPNHISYVDAIILAFAAKRPMRYMVFKGVYDKAPKFFDAIGAIPVASNKEGGTAKSIEQALARGRAALKNGETLVIFPEGKLTANGAMARFKRGFERIVEDLNVPVVPAHLDNLWGSYFSRRGVTLGQALKQIPRDIGVRFGPALETKDAASARDAVQLLSAEALELRVRRESATLPRAFFRMAKRLWKKTVVTDTTGMSLTYGKALAATVLLGGALARTLPPAKRVGVLLPPSAGGVLANTALASQGRIPVNLNYTASADAVEHALKTAEIEAVLTSRKVVETLKTKGAALPNRPYIYIEDILKATPKWKSVLTYLALRILPSWLGERLYLRKAAKSLDDEATVVFTSGSTALPKGVVLTHLNLQSNMQMVADTFPFTKADSMLGVLPFFHSFGFTITLWFPLLRGLTSGYHSHPLEMDSIAKLATRLKPTILLGTPTFLQRYTDKIPAAAFATLKHVIAGAEKLRPAVAESFEKKFGTRPLEGYGSTELSPVAAVSVPDHKTQPGTKDGSVGQTLPGTAAVVVDPDTLAPIKRGEQGMLLIKGPHVMKGYLNEPAKTSAVLKDGWYVTGDIAVIDEDGFIFLKGRHGNGFAKIAGEMVPFAGVSEFLHKAAGLSDETFIVTSVPDEKRGERLVVLHTGYAGDLNVLLTKARESGLPGVWTPGAGSFYKVDIIPVLGTGKVDLKALKELALKLATAPK